MISVLVPFRGTSADRIKVWAFLAGQWQATLRAEGDLELIVDSDGREDGEVWSYAVAANRCRAAATGDVLLLYGADQMPPLPATFERIRRRIAEVPWLAVYSGTMYLSRWATLQVLTGARVDESLLGLAHRIEMCMPIIAVRAEVYDAVGGFDERFQGWGAEDSAFRLALQGCYPDGDDVAEPGDSMICLYHPAAPHTQDTRRNMLMYEDLAAASRAGRLAERLREVRADG